MCTYNGARFLQEQLESIAAQARLPDELIICDDRSTDETVEIINGFARHAGFRVRAVINENTLGVTKNFEKAIELCQSEIIALADQDDVWHSHKLECIANIFMRWPETVAVFSDADIIDAKSERLPGRLWETFFFGRKEQKQFGNGRALDVLLKHPVVTGATMAFRERLRGLVLPLPTHHTHDYWISILLAACGDFRPIPQSLIRYRQHGNQQIGVGPARLTLRERTESAIRDSRRSYLAEIDCFSQVRTRLLTRRDEFPCGEAAIRLVIEKISHRSTRARLAPSRLLRLPAIVREMAKLRYWRYSEGWRSVARDVFL